MKANSHKAKSLIELKALGVPVPEFEVIFRGEALRLPPADTLILRGCMRNEDSASASMAGLGKSIGPVTIREAGNALTEIFSDEKIVEIIVQRFMEDPTGVLFYTGLKTGYFEYAREGRAVTAGREVPFCAVFPNELNRYSELQFYLRQLFEKFGPFNAEVAFGSTLQFLQIRPVTAKIKFERQNAELQMLLQEYEKDSFTQTEFCHDLTECPGKELSLIRLLCDALPGIFREIGLHYDPITPMDFIKIGDQIFMIGDPPTLNLNSPRSIFRLAKWALMEVFSPNPSNFTKDEQLMRRAFALRTLSELPGITKLKPLRSRILTERFKCRERLVSLVPEESLEAVATCERLLSSPILKSSQDLIWKRFRYETDEGEVVVSGDFEAGPFIEWKYIENKTLPNKFTVLTEELYPEIGKHLESVQSIICLRGAITSHLAILAREKNVPLWIRTPRPEYNKRIQSKT